MSSFEVNEMANLEEKLRSTHILLAVVSRRLREEGQFHPFEGGSENDRDLAIAVMHLANVLEALLKKVQADLTERASAPRVSR
jgi:hypothetical protein